MGSLRRDVMAPEVLYPDWPAPVNIGALMTLRHAGASAAPHASWNLGAHVGDSPDAVQRNRCLLRREVGVDPLYLDQVHGAHVHTMAHRESGQSPAAVGPADACVTDRDDLACTILVADCLPVLLCARDGSAVGAAHAGWRGLAAGVIERSVAALCRLASCTPGDIVAWLGPAIGPDRFEVGGDVVAAFGEGPRLRPLRPGKWLADLPGLARDRLHTMGVAQVSGHDGSAPWCTVSSPGRWFSYRRDGRTGRMAACVWRKPPE